MSCSEIEGRFYLDFDFTSSWLLLRLRSSFEPSFSFLLLFCSIISPLVAYYVLTRLRNKAKLKAMELVDPRNKVLRMMLQSAEFALMAGNDVVHDDGDEREDGPTGSGSASDDE